VFTFNEERLGYLLNKLKLELDKKIDKDKYIKELVKNDAGAFEIVADDKDPFDAASMIKVSDAKALVPELEEGDKANAVFADKQLSEAVFTDKEKEALKEIIENGGSGDVKFEVMSENEFAFAEGAGSLNKDVVYIVAPNDDPDNPDDDANKIIRIYDHDNMIFKADIVGNLESDVADVPLSANQGKVLKEEYLDNMKHVYLTEAEYVALMQVTVDDAAGAFEVVENIANADAEISINDDIIVWNNKALEEAGGVLIAVGNKVNVVDDREDDVAYHITDADELYGLTDEQMDQLKKAYEHTFVDLDSMYASKKEIYDAKRNKNGQSFASLAERLFNLDTLMETLLIDTTFFDMRNLEESIEAYGVHVNFEEQEFNRILKAKDMQQADFNRAFPWAGIRRCNMKDGAVVCYEDEPIYAEDGSNGDVMVEIPKFYYCMVPVRLEASDADEADQQIAEAKWMIAPRHVEGFKVHPAFIRNGQEVEHIYI
jgi:hypothetical protein